MSDCFDHELDAYEQDEAMGGHGSGFGLGDGGSRPRSRRHSSRQEPVCRNCLSQNVFFHEEGEEKWILYDSRTGKPHLCGVLGFYPGKVRYGGREHADALHELSQEGHGRMEKGEGRGKKGDRTSDCFDQKRRRIMRDVCHKCGKEYDLRSEAGAGVCDACRFVGCGTKAATHEITASYFPNKGEVDLSWKDLETGKTATLTANVDRETGMKISDVVWPCVYSTAVAKKSEGKTFETLIPSSLTGNGIQDGKVTHPSVTGLVLPYNNSDLGVGECKSLTIPDEFARSIGEFVKRNKKFPLIKMTLEIL